jgi:hypothetical protein
MVRDLRQLQGYLDSLTPFFEEAYPEYSRPNKALAQVKKKVTDLQRAMAEQFPKDVEDFVSPYGQPEDIDGH